MKHVNYLLRVGHVLTLLIIGVLGGLMVPFPSEAGTPTATITVDASTYSLGLSSCAVPTGYRACYSLPQNAPYTGSNGVTPRTFTIKGYAGSLPRILVGDSNGSGLDVITLTTVEFAPTVLNWGTTTANTTEKHTLKVTINHKFDNVPNPKGTYLFALRTSGMFKSNVTGLSASSDFVKFQGTGVFTGTTLRNLLAPPPSGATCDPYNSRSSPLDVNYCPLKRTMATTSVLTSSFSSSPALAQISPYPGYPCDNGVSCTPSVTLTMTAVLVGPDSFILSSSNDAAGGSCNLDPTGPPSSTQAIPCHTGGKGKKSLDQMIAEYFAQQTIKDNAAFAAEGAESTPACTGEECVCQDPDTCGGTITITKNMFFNNCSIEPTCPSPVTFNFTITGPTNTTASIPVPINPGENSGTASTNVTVSPGTYTVSEDPGSGYFLTDIASPCGVFLTPTPFTVESGGTVTCTFSNSDQAIIP
jgi:hypothetical protein